MTFRRVTEEWTDKKGRRHGSAPGFIQAWRRIRSWARSWRSWNRTLRRRLINSSPTSAEELMANSRERRWRHSRSTRPCGRDRPRARPQGAPCARWHAGSVTKAHRPDTQKKARLAELLAEQPSLPVPYLGDHVRLRHSTVYRWMAK